MQMVPPCRRMGRAQSSVSVCGLREVAERYFVEGPHQHFEGYFDWLTTAAEGFSNRRNEVAHAMVFPIDKIAFFSSRFVPAARGKPQFAAIPPYFLGRKHEEGFAVYAYTFAELSTLARRLIKLEGSLGEYPSSLWSRHAPPEAQS
jgi:hypothetical protein